MSEVKKVLIISYYWPPSGGSGVQRWLYFVKYLRSYGWEPIVYTVDGGEYPYTDEGLSAHIPQGISVMKRKIWEPYSIYRWLTGSTEKINPSHMVTTSKSSFVTKMSMWLRGNLFIPDPRIFWVLPSVRFLKKYLKSNPVDLIVSTGPPQSMHLIARALKRNTGIKWLADFRDPWTQIYFFEQLKLSLMAKAVHRYLEKSVLKEADAITTVSRNCKLGLEKIVNRPIQVITNGYEEFEMSSNSSQTKIRMLYTGALSLDRDPDLLWSELQHYLNEHPEVRKKFELIFIGTIDPEIFNNIRKAGLADVLICKAAIPHGELQSFLSEADILLLIGVNHNKGVITGKFFEYLFLQKPILSISPPGSDVEQILEETCSGWNADFTDVQAIRNAIVNTFTTLTDRHFSPKTAVIEQYSRKNLCSKMADTFNAILAN